MNKIDLGQAANTIASLGVIVGIAFQAVELNQNQDIGRAQVRNDIAQSEQELSMWDFDNAMGAIERLQSGELTETDLQTLTVRSSMWLRHVQNIHYQFELGLYDEEEYENQIRQQVEELDQNEVLKGALYREVSTGLLDEADIPMRQWAGTFLNQAALDYWENAKGGYDPEFVQFVDERIIGFFSE